MPQVAQEVDSKAATVAPLFMVGSYQVPFTFSQSSTSTRTVASNLQNVPDGTVQATIAIQAFSADYTNNDQYGFGAFQVAMSLNGLSSASCTITLRDNHTNSRQWEGTATGLVTYYGQ
jgi:hypothetical protein